MTRAAIARFDQSALTHNLGIIRKTAPNSKVMAVIKANAYGHGIVETAQALNGVDAYAVAHLEEAVALRNAGVQKDILLLQGLLNEDELSAAVKHRLTTCVHDTAQLDLLESNTNSALDCWLKIDTGMHRLGIRLQELPTFLSRLAALKHIGVSTIMSHFANANVVEDEINDLQIKRFKQLALPTGVQRSLANSAAIFSRAESHFDWVRPGISLYGISPFSDRSAQDLGLKPFMSFESQVITIKQVKQGESVGYGALWCAEQDTYIAVIRAGYGDGYPRHAQNGTPVWINNKIFPLAGRVSMDMISVDLGPTPSVKIGDTAQLWGDKNPIEQVAAMSNTIPYELTCKITQRVTRHYV
ncbi:MAG: alanine racemase [Gammaproteobacteria bacterium]|nr:alanine racemase [Gammaproteobacteria bacterium]